MPAAKRLPFKRVLLKLSGEVLKGAKPYGIDLAALQKISDDIKRVYRLGTEIAVVIGGGNIFRGIPESAKGMDRANADYMGMLATVMNSLAMQEALERDGVPTRVMSAIQMPQIAGQYIRRRAMRQGSPSPPTSPSSSAPRTRPRPPRGSSRPRGSPPSRSRSAATKRRTWSASARCGRSPRTAG